MGNLVGGDPEGVVPVLTVATANHVGLSLGKEDDGKQASIGAGKKTVPTGGGAAVGNTGDDDSGNHTDFIKESTVPIEATAKDDILSDGPALAMTLDTQSRIATNNDDENTGDDDSGDHTDVIKESTVPVGTTAKDDSLSDGPALAMTLDNPS